MTLLSKLKAADGPDTFAMPEHGITCFHCGETFTTIGDCRDHFGFDPSSDPACRIKMGGERGLVMALRKAEAEIYDLRDAIHQENTESHRAYYAQQARHRNQLEEVDDAAYARGLEDGRNIAGDAETQPLKAAIDRLTKLAAASNLSVRELAKLSGVSPATTHRVIHGQCQTLGPLLKIEASLQARGAK